MNGWRLLLDDISSPDSGVTALPSSASASLRPSGRALLCLSDIHGDLWALESVLAAVKHLDLCGIVAAGDHVHGGAQPFEVWTRLQSLGVHLARGPSDLALGALAAGVDLTPTSKEEEARLQQYLQTKQQLGDVVCRRLAELPSTLVVSLDDTSGVMVMHGSPVDDCRGLDDDDDLPDHVACVAEDVLVTGATHTPFARRVARPDEDKALLEEYGLAPLKPLLVVNAGSVGASPVVRRDGRRTAHAVLLAPGNDGRVHAWGHDVLVMEKARARNVG